MRYWYLEYRPIPQSWPNLRCTAHGPSFARVRYMHTGSIILKPLPVFQYYKAIIFMFRAKGWLMNDLTYLLVWERSRQQYRCQRSHQPTTSADRCRWTTEQEQSQHHCKWGWGWMGCIVSTFSMTHIKFTCVHVRKNSVGLYTCTCNFCNQSQT